MKERVKQLCKNMGISMGKAESDLGFAKGYLSKIDSSVPSAKKLQALADYFHVSVDYLITGQEKEETLYYFTEETAKIAQQLFENKGMRILFDAARDSRPEDLKMAADLLERLKGTNQDA